MAEAELIGKDTLGKVLFAGLSIIVAMLSWWMMTVWTKVDNMALEFARRGDPQQIVNELRTRISLIEGDKYKLNLAEERIVELKSRLDALERKLYGSLSPNQQSPMPKQYYLTVPLNEPTLIGHCPIGIPCID